MCDSFDRPLSTVEVAAAVGVGESSVKRWIDSGSLSAEKTPGGHRRVGLPELYRFLRAQGRKLVDPSAIGLSPESGGDAAKTPLEVCQESLRTGNSRTLESIMQVLRFSESNSAAILDRTIYPAFQALRATCNHPSEECLVLHRAISMLKTALTATMSPTEANLGSKSPRVVLADIGYEVDGVPTLFAEASVWDQARCLQLGTNVPSTVIEGALESFSADVLWLSASGPAKKRQIQADWQSIVERAARLKVKVVTFGDALPRLLGNDGIRVGSFSEFRGFLSALSH